MNRATRRQARRTRAAAPARRYDRLAPLDLLVNAIPHQPGEKAGEHLKTRAAFDRLVDGSADTDDFDHVAMTLNMVKIRALQIDATLADLLERGQDAMGDCKARYLRLGRFGFDGPGLQVLRDCIDAAEAIIDASSPQQMRTARDVVADLLYGKGTAARLTQQAKHAQTGRRAQHSHPGGAGGADL